MSEDELDTSTQAYLDLAKYLLHLWTAAGSPPVRQIADELTSTHTLKISSSTVFYIIKLRGMPALDKVVAVGSYLGGDPVKLNQMWAAAKSGQITPPPWATAAETTEMLASIDSSLARIAEALETMAGKKKARERRP